MTQSNDSVVMVHKSGANFVENYYIKAIVKNETIRCSLDSKEVVLLK